MDKIRMVLKFVCHNSWLIFAVLCFAFAVVNLIHGEIDGMAIGFFAMLLMLVLQKLEIIEGKIDMKMKNTDSAVPFDIFSSAHTIPIESEVVETVNED